MEYLKNLLSFIKHLLLKVVRFIRSSRKKALLSGLVLLIFITSIYALILYWPRQAKAAWFDDNWAYRQKTTVSNAGSAQTNFQVSIQMDTATLITAGKMLSTCNDIRVTDATGTLLPFVLEEGSAPCNNAATKIWVKIPSIPTTNQTLYIYYGNPTAVSSENGNNVFDFFDNFDTNSLNTNTWTATGGTSFASGALTITTGSVYSNTQVLPDSRSYIYEYRTKWSSTLQGYAGLSIDNTQSSAGNNTESDKLIYMTTDNNNSLAQLGFAADGTSASYNLALSAALYTPTAATYYIDGFSMDATQIKYWHEGSQTGSTVTGSWTAAPYLWLGYFSGSAASTTDTTDLTVDWVRARKFAATAPAASTSSSEEIGTGPIAYWKFDEGANNTCSGGANDACNSVNNNTMDGAFGATTAAPTWQSEDMCLSGKCLYFDGSNDILSDTSFGSFASNLTVSLWVKGPKQGNTNRFFELAQAASAGLQVWMGTNGTINLDNTGGPTSEINSPASFGDNAWHHVEVTRSGTTYTLYIDGKSYGTTGGTAPTYTRVYVGTSSSGTTFFNGFIDEVKVYGYARSQAQINTDYASRGASKGSGAVLGASADNNPALTNGLFGYWKLDEASGNRSDSSGNAYTLTDLNTVTSNPGQFGLAGQFTRANSEALYTADNANLSLSGTDFTLTAWVYQDSTTAGDRCIICKADVVGNKREYILTRSTAGPWSFAVSSNGTSFDGALTSSLTPAASTWYFVVAWYDSKSQTLNLQVNNGAVESTSFTGTVRDDTSEFMLGAAGTDAAVLSNFDGRIDEARVYRRALSNTERDFLYNWAPGPLGYWNLNEGSGTTAFDIGTGAVNGTITGAPFVPGKYGDALAFNGTTGRYAITASTGIYNNLTGTVSLWYKQNTALGAAELTTLVSTVTAAETFGWAIQLSGSTVSCNGAGGVAAPCINLRKWTPETDKAVAYTFTPNTWYHLTYSWDNTNQRLYINGALVLTAAVVGPSSGSGPFCIGGDSRAANCGAQNTNSEIDDVRVYNYTRTNKQIVQDMNAGHPAGGSPVGSMLGWWKFDEGTDNRCSGGTNDACNSGFDGTLLDAAQTNMAVPATTTSGWQLPETGKVNGAIAFDGSNDVVNAGSDSTIDDLPASGMSISAWIKPVSMGQSSQGVIMAKNSGATPSSGWLLQFAGTNALKFSVDGSTDLVVQTSNNVITLGSWNHIVMSWNGVITTASSVHIYINGREVTYATNTNGAARVSDAASSLFIGNDSVGTSTFDGLIDELKLYNYSVTPSEVRIDYNAGAAVNYATGASTEASILTGGAGVAPIAFWNMNENTGVTAFDTSGSGLTGTLTNGPLWVSGKSGSGIKFDAADDVITVGTSNVLNLTGDLTIEAWIRPNSAGENGNGRIFDRVTAAPAGYLFGVGGVASGQPQLTLTASGVGSVDSNNNIITYGAWNHVVVTRSGTTVTFYVNGLQQGTGSLASITSASGATGRLGNNAAGDRTFDGNMDEVKIYNYARSQAQIAYDYDRGAPNFLYKLDECQGATAHNTAPAASGLAPGNDGTITPGAGSNTSVGTCGSGTSSEMWNDGTTGKINGSLGFDGTDDYVDISSSISIPNNQDITIAAWVNIDPSKSGTITEIFSGCNDPSVTPDCTGADYDGVLFKKDATNTLTFNAYYFRSGTNRCTITSSKTVPLGQWVHVAVVYDENDASGAATFYINGVPSYAATTTCTGAVSAAITLYPAIGAVKESNNGATATFVNNLQGQIDDVRMYFYQLSADQIKQVYNNGAAFFGPATGTP